MVINIIINNIYGYKYLVQTMNMYYILIIILSLVHHNTSLSQNINHYDILLTTGAMIRCKKPDSKSTYVTYIIISEKYIVIDFKWINCFKKKQAFIKF